MKEVMIYDTNSGKIVADSGGNVLYISERGEITPDSSITCKLKGPSGEGVFSVGDKAELVTFECGNKLIGLNEKVEIQGVKSKPYNDYQADVQRWQALHAEFSRKSGAFYGSEAHRRIKEQHEAAVRQLEEIHDTRITDAIGKAPRLDDQL